MSDARALSVVAPAFNEERRLPALLDRVERDVHLWLAPTGLALRELIVVDDGSSDGTGVFLADAARRSQRLRVVTLPRHRGKGAAVREGMLAATGDYALLTDVDMSTPLEEIAKLWAPLEGGADVVIGSRAVAGSVLGARQPAYRELLGKTFNLALRVLTGIRFRDTQCGFKLFRAGAARSLFERQRIDGYLYDAELCVNARRLRLRVAEVPVRWSHDPDTRVQLLRSAPRIVFDLLRLALPSRRAGPTRRDAGTPAASRR